MHLSILLAQTPPRERAGKRTSNRITFQHDWTLCKVMELHDKPDPYAVLCDYHEDVVILNDEASPTEAYPIQVKTGKNSPWTASALLSKTGKAQKNSPLGKLYLGCTDFSATVPELRFVATAVFDIQLSAEPASTERKQFSLEDLNPKIAEKIATKLQAELGLKEAHPLLPNVVFEFCPLSVQDHSIHALGKVTKFLESHYPNHGISHSAAYRALSGEIMRLTSYEYPLTNFEDILFHSGISRTRFQALLDLIPSAKDPHQIWLEAKQDLTASVLAFPEIMAIRREWLQYEADRTDFSNQILQDTRKQAKALMLVEVTKPECVNIVHAITNTMAKLKTSLLVPKEYLIALSLIEYYEHQLSPSAPQSPQKAP
ncbi:MAG: DUF4297 domain-containing protein [Verrucomicrobiota bacterium]